MISSPKEAQQNLDESSEIDVCDDSWYEKTFNNELLEREEAEREASKVGPACSPLQSAKKAIQDEVAAALALGGSAEEELSRLAADAAEVEREGWVNDEADDGTPCAPENGDASPIRDTALEHTFGNSQDLSVSLPAAKKPDMSTPPSPPKVPIWSIAEAMAELRDLTMLLDDDQSGMDDVSVHFTANKRVSFVPKFLLLLVC